MKTRHYISLALAALILVGSFLLPNAVAGILDLRRLDSLMLIDSQAISFDAVPELSLAERISLAGRSNTDVLPLNTGNNLSSETAAINAAEETMRFFANGPFELIYDDLTFGDGLVSLIIDGADPTRYMIVWEFDMLDSLGNSVSIILDDETGKIVRLIYRMGNRDGTLLGPERALTNDEMFYTAALHLSEMMAAYFGKNVTLADYHFSGTLSYYRADISENGQTIPTYGVIRPASFTMNERV